MKTIVLLLAFIVNLNVFGQLTNGTVAPDFTLTDYYGNSHNLYAYLADGKTVFVEIFAAHCPSCWSYHQTHRLKNMYNLYGPDGTDEIIVLALEHDEYNDSNAFTGNHQPWVTAGDWLTGTPYPIFNVEFPDRGVFVDYNVHFYPVVYKICPNKIIERVNTSTTVAQLYQKVQACQVLSINEETQTPKIFYDQLSRKVMLENFIDLESVTLYDLQGKNLRTYYTFQNSGIDFDDFQNAVYVFEIKTATETQIEKLVVN